MLNVIFAISTAFFITFLTIPIVINVVRKNEKFLDTPSERASHKTSVPTFGGIAIFLGLLFAIVFWINLSEYANMQYLLSSILIIFFIGVIDDFVSLAPIKK